MFAATYNLHFLSPEKSDCAHICSMSGRNTGSSLIIVTYVIILYPGNEMEIDCSAGVSSYAEMNEKLRSSVTLAGLLLLHIVIQSSELPRTCSDLYLRVAGEEYFLPFC